MHPRLQRICSVLVILVMLALPVSALAVPASTSASSISAYDKTRPQDLVESNLYAQSAVLIDARTGEVLFSKAPDTKLNPASITKILTAMLVLEKCDLDEMVTAKISAMGTYEATWVPLQDGESMTAKDMLYGLLLKSYNDVAAALAVHVGGSLSGFAEMMNRKAQELGCTNSNFVVPHGLTTENHYTTANDMAKIARAALQNETFRQIVSTQQYVFPSSNKRNDSISLTNSNKMLPGSGSEYAYEGNIGVKTGYTLAAKHTFVGAAQRDGISLICVVMGSQGPESLRAEGKWMDAQKLLDYGFAAYEKLDVVALYAANPVECDIEGYIEGDAGRLKLDLGDSSALAGIIVKKSEKEAAYLNFQQNVTVRYTADRIAPIERNEKIGEMTYSYGGGSVTVDLLASRNVLQAVVAASPISDDLSFDASSSAAVPPTLTDIAVGIKHSPVRFLALLLLVPVLILLGLVVSMLVDLSRQRKRLRARTSRSRGYY